MFMHTPTLEFSDKVRILTGGSLTVLSVTVSTSCSQSGRICPLLQGKMSASYSPNKAYIGQNGNEFDLNLLNEALNSTSL